MYRLFTSRPVNKKGTVLFPDFFYASTGLKQQAFKIVSHYRANRYMVRSNHILTRLVDTISVQYTGDPYDYVRRVNNELPTLAMALHLTHESNRGLVHHHAFFDRDSTEIIMINSEPFSFDNIKNNWKDLEPVKVLRHPHCDTNMVVFNNSVDPNYYSTSKGDNNDSLYVISINVAMLGLQYALWNKEQLDKTNTNIGMESAVNFVAMYPLVNMIYSFLDYAIFNRLVNVVNDRPNPPTRNQHSFMVINYYDRIDRTINGLVEIFKKRRIDFATTLMTIPAVDKKDMFDVLFPKIDVRPTIQVIWALNVAVLPTISTLLKLDAMYLSESNNQANPSNTQSYNFLRIMLKRLESDNVLNNQLDVETLLPLKRYIQNDIATYLQS